jgi:hypothetical protein
MPNIFSNPGNRFRKYYFAFRVFGLALLIRGNDGTEKVVRPFGNELNNGF